MSTPMPDDEESNDIHWSKWTAIGTTLIAICALGTSFWQGYTLQQHNKLSVRPYLEFEANFQRNADGLINFDLYVNNNGLGPAQVTQVKFYADGKILNSAHQIWPALQIFKQDECLGAGNVGRFYKIADRQMVIKTTAKACRLNQQEYEKLMASLRLELTYQSLYGESFQAGWGLPIKSQ